ncbi:MAG: TolC family protein, partial [Planctomycetes bacterium]|nr:TolC family protein [Planctomycetota bacterium]
VMVRSVVLSSPCTGSWRDVLKGSVWIGVLAFHAFALLGCASHRSCCPDGSVETELFERTDHASSIYVPPGQIILPPGVVLEDGIDVDEAISVALANNSAFQATLTQLDMAGGDVVQAGLVANPSFVTFIPVGVKQWEWTLYTPIESFILRPWRVASAQDDYQRIASDLVQNGLTLVRDVRIAHTDLALAAAQARLAEEATGIQQGIADLTQKRLQRGDISELETLTARVDALNAEASIALRQQDVAMARSRLATVLGLPFDAENLYPEALTPPEFVDIDVDQMIGEALASRPDLRAAEWRVQAATERVQVARRQFLRIDVGADANSRGDKGFEAGPGLRFDIPVFNRNEGGIMRAEAELEQALYNRDALRDQIVDQVRTAAAQVRQARDNLAILQQRVAPSIDVALEIARKGFEDGGAPYLLVLQTTTLYLDARSRTLDQTAALCRAHAELERAIGHKLAAAPEPIPMRSEPMMEGGEP